MTEQEFQNISMYVFVGGLIVYMCFIMYRLAKDSNAGKFGMLIIFIALGAGVFGFVVKEVLVHMLEK